jgi:hypothetical protein
MFKNDKALLNLLALKLAGKNFLRFSFDSPVYNTFYILHVR